MKRKIYKRLFPVGCFFVLAIILLAACKDSGIDPKDDTDIPEEKPSIEIPFRWTFQDDIPGWAAYISSNAAETTMHTDAEYLNGLVLMGSNIPLRWMPEQTVTISGFTAGCIQTANEDADSFLEIANVQGPFKTTFNYTNTGDNPGPRHPVLYINGDKIKDGETASQINGTSTRRILEHSYFWTDKATVQLGAVGGFRLYDVIITPIEPVFVASVTINEGDFSMTVGEAARQLSVSVLPADASNKEISWSCSNPSLATVSGTGLITALDEGTASITASAKDGSGKTDSITVTITFVPVENVIIEGGDFSLAAGNSKTLTAAIIPSNASNRNLIWSSSNTGAAAVSASGELAAVAPGISIITAAAKDNPEISGSITVTVSAPSGFMTAQEIFSFYKGQRASSYGWADLANGGAGLLYANPPSLTIIEGPSTKAKREAFTNAINTDNAKFIIISGDVDLGDGVISDSDKSYFDEFQASGSYNRLHGDIIFNVGSNTTIIGINDARLMFGGLRINNKQNIIIRNITFYDAHGSTAQDTGKYPESKASIDALVVRGTSKDVWVDHCKFTNGVCDDMIRNFNHDGAFDIPEGKNVTVSWCEFTNYDKVMLVAGDDSLTRQEDRQITLHHNYFHYTTQRMPRTRGTQMHVYNNYYDDIGVPGNNGYAMGPGVNAHFIVENNFYGSIRSNKVVEYYDNPVYPAIVWSAGNNKTVARSPHDSTAGSKPWEPAYIYILEDNPGLPISVPAGAGPTLAFVK